MLPKKGSHDATRKCSHNSGAPTPLPPVHGPLVGQEHSTSIKEKSTGDSVDESSVVGDRIPDTAN